MFASRVNLTPQIIDIDDGARRVVRIVDPGDARFAEHLGAKGLELEAVAVAFAQRDWVREAVRVACRAVVHRVARRRIDDAATFFGWRHHGQGQVEDGFLRT